MSVADPGFPIGGCQPCRGAPTPEAATFHKFVCQNERILTLRGCTPAAPPLDLPLYVILSNKTVTIKVGQLTILNVSFIYNKTSPSKGGMIGTVYCNYHHSVLILYLSRSSPEDSVTLKFRSTHVLHGPMCAQSSITANSQ